METPPEYAGPVLLFDGECGLCNRVVRLLLRLDRRGVLRFAPLQGPAAQEFLRTSGLPTKDFDSLVFLPAWAWRGTQGFFLRTDGVVAALRVCGGGGRMLAAMLNIFPRGLRDVGYKFVARTRHLIFGRARMQTLRPEWAARFIE